MNWLDGVLTRACSGQRPIQMHRSDEQRFDARPPAPELERSFSAASWAGLSAALIILMLSVACSLYRLTLPSDGWSVGLFVYAGKAQLIFGRNLLGASSPLQTGDVLVAVEGQPAEAMLARALALGAQRPANWAAGETARYIVQRDGRDLALGVPLRRRPARLLLQLLSDDPFRFAGFLAALSIGIVVFVLRPRSQPAWLLLMFGASISAYAVSTAVSGERAGPADLFYRSAYWPAELFNTMIWLLLLNPILGHLFLVFPVVKKPLRAHPLLAPAALYMLPLAAFLDALAYEFERPWALWSTYYTLVAVQFPLMILSGVVSAAHTYLALPDPVVRAQSRWMILGAGAPLAVAARRSEPSLPGAISRRSGGGRAAGRANPQCANCSIARCHNDSRSLRLTGVTQWLFQCGL